MPTSVSLIWVSVVVSLTEAKSCLGSPCGLQHELRKPQPSFVVQHLPVMACTFLCLGAAYQPQAWATYKVQESFVQPVFTVKLVMREAGKPRLHIPA